MCYHPAAQCLTWLQSQMFASELKIDNTVLNEPFRTHLVTAGHVSTIRPHLVSQSEHVTKITMSTETIECMSERVNEQRTLHAGAAM